MSCNSPSPEFRALMAELEQARMDRQRALKALRQQALVVVALTEQQLDEASPVPEHPEATQPTVPVATPLTQEERAARKRASAAARQRACRLRKKVDQQRVTPRDGVTPERDEGDAQRDQGGWVEDLNNPPPQSRVTSRSFERGALAVVQVTAPHEAREKPQEPLPPEVEPLREAWTELVVPHGFAPWPARTPKRLVQDALAALQRRPLEEWRQVFALVPRSRACRGELPRQNRRMDLVRLLLGAKDDSGYEPAEKLLMGFWSVDPEPGAASPPSAAAPSEPAPAQETPVDTPAGRAWAAMLNALRTEKRDYALRWLVDLQPYMLHAGVLVLEVPDRFRAEWLTEHYGELMRHLGAAAGVRAVQYMLPGGGP